MGTKQVVNRSVGMGVIDVPKVIHYCWFGRGPLPKLAQRCIASWKKYLPDYEIKEWNEDNFDVGMNDYMKEAYASKKYAFVSDYARLWILHKHGGVYFDVDVEVIKPLDDILAEGSFLGCERDVDSRVNPGLGAGAAPGLAIYKEMIDSYEGVSFVKSDGKLDTTTIVDRTTEILKKHGLMNDAGIQSVAQITVYPTEFFAPKSFDTGKMQITSNTRSIHWYDASWLPWYKKAYQPIKYMLPGWLRALVQKRTRTGSLGNVRLRVAIVTFQHDNYGTRLQNYALSNAVSSLGYEPYSIISVHPIDAAKTAIRKAQSIIFPVGEKSIQWKNARIKNEKFQTFVKDKINTVIINRPNLGKSGELFRKVIAGSDQIWNPDHISRHLYDAPFYFLEFVGKDKRIAYAPSFGKKVVPNELQELYGRGLEGFSSISAREADGAKIIEAKTSNVVPVVPDPTFLLGREDWHSLSVSSSTHYAGRKYIAVYFLSNQSPAVIKAIQSYARKNRLEVVNIAGNMISSGQIVPTPGDFLAILENAETVFTDSFHGAVFSIIFNTPFLVFDRTDKDQSSRIEMLLSTHHLSDHYNTDASLWPLLLKTTDFTKANRTLQRKREVGMDYLKQALGDSSEK